MKSSAILNVNVDLDCLKIYVDVDKLRFLDNPSLYMEDDFLQRIQQFYEQFSKQWSFYNSN